MTREEIFKNIQQTIKKAFPEADLNSITITTHLRNDLGADSMDNISLMMELEDQFDASLPMEEAAGITNIELCSHTPPSARKRCCLPSLAWQGCSLKNTCP
jgi:acyl carrier protein